MSNVFVLLVLLLVEGPLWCHEVHWITRKYNFLFRAVEISPHVRPWKKNLYMLWHLLAPLPPLLQLWCCCCTYSFAGLRSRPPRISGADVAPGFPSVREVLGKGINGEKISHGWFCECGCAREATSQT
jgi:hypothetical protein